MHAEILSLVLGNLGLTKLGIMMKKVINYFAIPLAIIAITLIALSSNKTVDPEIYSTDGLELNYTVSNDMAFNANTRLSAIKNRQDEALCHFFR